MDIEIIIQSIMGLVALLAILILFLFIAPYTKEDDKKTLEIKEKDDKNQNKIQIEKKVQNTNFDYLIGIVKNKKSSTIKLKETLELIINYHGTIHSKLGIRAHPDFDPYMDVLFTVCRHPNADKDMIINFDKELGKLNPEYKEDIDLAITRGLNSRRV